VIGDWRDQNKGVGIVAELRRAAPDIEFRALAFQAGQHELFYKDADLYLCLSQSEGGSYSLADAEACELPIVTTDVGNFQEFEGATVFPWDRRGEISYVLDLVRGKLAEGRASKGFYSRYLFTDWSEKWNQVVNRDWKEKHETLIPMPAEDPAPGEAPEVPADAPPPLPALKPRSVYKMPVGQVTILGLGGGIGNAIFNIPLMSALKSMGRRILAYVQTDYPSEELFARCRYLDGVITPDDQVPIKYDCPLIAGPWRPKNMTGLAQVRQYTWIKEPFYPEPEWSLLLKFARELGWNGRKPDVSDWCTGLNRDRRWDVGIIQGCKPETRWKRKRYPKMAEVAERFLSAGLTVGVFGTEDDRDPAAPIPGDDMLGKIPLREMPDALASCRVVVGTDSGMTHLASSLGVPAVVIYTATNDVKGDPVGQKYIKLYRDIPCSPCQSTFRWDKCKNWICQEIPTDEVVRAAMALLEWTK
jgi:hypothetical protein